MSISTLEGVTRWDTEPGEFAEKRCKICNNICKVTRNLNGPTYFVMAASRRMYDSFRCTYVDNESHKLAFCLYFEVRKTSSVSLKKIIQDDLDNVLKKLKEDFNEESEKAA